MYLYLLAAGPHANRLITPLLAATIMTRNLHTPFYISISILGACLLFASLVEDPKKDNGHKKYVAIVDQEPTSSPGEESHPDWTPTSLPAFPSYREALRSSLEQIGSLFHSPTSKFCLAAFFVKKVAFASESFVFQYASEKFLWPLRQTTWLRAAAGSGAVFATLLAWPLATSMLRRKGIAACKLDLNAVRISLVVVFSSFLCLWRASSGLALIIGTLQGFVK